MKSEMNHRTQNRVDQLLSSPPMTRPDVVFPAARTQELRAVFLRRHIPTEEAAPEVRMAMLDLLGIREQYREDGEEALHDGDEFREEAAQRYYDESNERLHDAYEEYVKGLGGKADNREASEPEKSKTPEASLHFVGVEDLCPSRHKTPPTTYTSHRHPFTTGNHITTMPSHSKPVCSLARV